MATKLKEDTSRNYRQAWLTTLYKTTFPLVAKHISRMGGSFEEAKDLFQDALVIYYEKIERGEVVLKYTEKSYLFGIARYLWNKRYQENNHQVPLDQFGADFD